MQNTLKCQVKGSLQNLSTGAPALAGYSSCAVRAAHFHNLNGDSFGVSPLRGHFVLV